MNNNININLNHNISVVNTSNNANIINHLTDHVTNNIQYTSSNTNTSNILIQNINKNFGDIKVLNDLTIQINAKDIIGIAGPSGCGKSTLLRCIGKLEKIDSGQIILCSFDDTEIRNTINEITTEITKIKNSPEIDDAKIGFMFQDFQLFPHMTVLQNLTYSPLLHFNIKNRQKLYKKAYVLSQLLNKIKSLLNNIIVQHGNTNTNTNISINTNFSEKNANSSIDYIEDARIILDNLGILHKINTFPNQLSGGQKQRVALARSLMMHPELLLCDEPTSGLDVATIIDIVTLLKSVQKMGVTMIIASHDLDFLTKIADRIIVLKHGSIALDVETKTLNNDPVNYLKHYY